MSQISRLNLHYLLIAALPLILGINAGCNQSPKRVDNEIGPVIRSEWQAETKLDSSIATSIPNFGFESSELNEVLQKALSANQDIQIAARRLEISFAEKGIAGSRGIPQLALSASGSRSKSNIGAAPLTSTDNRFNLGLTLNWEVDLWGRIRNETSSSLALAEASEADYRAARHSLLSNVAKLWFNLQEASEQTNLAQETYLLTKKISERAEQLYRKGILDSVEYQLLSAQSQNAESVWRERDRIENSLKRSLKVLMGNYPDTAFSTTSFPALPSMIPAGLPADILENRPDIRSAERRLAAAEQVVKASRKQRYPNLSLTASAGQSSQELGDLLDGDFSVWSLFGNLTAPIFQAGAISRNIEISIKQHEIAQLQFEKILLDAFREVEQALANEGVLLQRVNLLEDAAANAESASLTTWERYERGLVNLVTALEAQNRSFEAQSQAIQTKSALYLNRVDLIIALGIDPF